MFDYTGGSVLPDDPVQCCGRSSFFMNRCELLCGCLPGDVEGCSRCLWQCLVKCAAYVSVDASASWPSACQRRTPTDPAAAAADDDSDDVDNIICCFYLYCWHVVSVSSPVEVSFPDT